MSSRQASAAQMGLLRSLMVIFAIQVHVDLHGRIGPGEGVRTVFFIWWVVIQNSAQKRAISP